jgi:hypothetical protein
MRQTAPKRQQTPAQKNYVAYIGREQWRRGLTADDLNEIRLREGSVDEHGMRVITLEKDEPKYDRPRLREYKTLGYEVTDNEYEYVLTMSQEDYLAREKARAQKSYDRKAIQRPGGQGAEFSHDRMEQLAPVSAQDFLQGRVPDVSGGVSVDEALAAMDA